MSFSEWAAKNGKVYSSKSEIALRRVSGRPRTTLAPASRVLRAHRPRSAPPPSCPTARALPPPLLPPPAPGPLPPPARAPAVHLRGGRAEDQGAQRRGPLVDHGREQVRGPHGRGVQGALRLGLPRAGEALQERQPEPAAQQRQPGVGRLDHEGCVAGAARRARGRSPDGVTRARAVGPPPHPSPPAAPPTPTPRSRPPRLPPPQAP